MQTFQYTAIHTSGKSSKGKMTAQNEMDLEDRLASQGLTIIDARAIKSAHRRAGAKLSSKELIMLCVHLEQLEKAGVPLLDSLADIRDSAETPVLKDVITDIYEAIRGGDFLSQAMAKQPKIFDAVFIGLVSAGERTGKMAETFAHLAHHIRWNTDLKRSIKKAITYPIVLIFFMTAAMAMMMVFVVPDLVDFLNSQGMELPFYTIWLINTSAFFVSYWPFIFSTPVAFSITLMILYKRSAKFRYKFDLMMISLPVVGQVIQKINFSRFTHFFSVTFCSGIGVIECLQTAQDVVGNEVIKEAVQEIAQNVSEGNTITQSISLTERFPGLVIRMFKVGEDSGNMEESLQNINQFYDREVEDSVAAMIGFIQPCLTLVLGLLMFWIIAAVFGPLYSSFSELSM